MTTDPQGHIGPAFNLTGGPDLLGASQQVSQPSYEVPTGPGEMALPPSQTPETITVDEIRRRGTTIYEAGWGATRPLGPRS